IVLMARRKEIVGRADHFEDEITGRPRLARCHRTIAKHALTVLVDADLFLDLISVHDSHGVPPVFLCSGERRPCGWRKAYFTNIPAAFAYLLLRRSASRCVEIVPIPSS